MQRAVEAARGFVGDVSRVKALLLFLWYVALCTMHVIAVVTLFGSVSGPFTFAFAALIVGAAGHFVVPAAGVILFEGYILHPVWPRLAFLIGDVIAAVFLGLTIGFGASGSRTWPAVGNIVLASVMIMQCVKYAIIGLDIRSWFEDPDAEAL